MSHDQCPSAVLLVQAEYEIARLKAELDACRKLCADEVSTLIALLQRNTAMLHDTDQMVLDRDAEIEQLKHG